MKCCSSNSLPDPSVDMYLKQFNSVRPAKIGIMCKHCFEALCGGEGGQTGLHC